MSEAADRGMRAAYRTEERMRGRMKPVNVTAPPPRHEALRLAQKVREEVGSGRCTIDTPTRYLLDSLAFAVISLAEECEALNCSKAEDSHGH